ncbi:MAG: HEAT repeat domain-containing protein [Elusimicrobia bacterium]|nr:HEAT repeat domain-containing protein [Elusimicrobiota bacterium]
MKRDEAILRCGRVSGEFESAAAGDVKAALLGKESRYSPDRTFDTLHVKLDLDVDFVRRAMRGTCTASVRAYVDKLSSLSFDAGGMRISGVKVDGKTARFKHDGKKLVVTVPPIRAGHEAQVEMRYQITDPEVGVHFVKPGPGTKARFPQMWSQGQPEDARFWFPCHDAPHEKATSEIVARVPRGFTAVSNGVLLESGIKGGKAFFHYRLNHPHALYLLSLCVGRFSEVKDRWQHVPVLYFCEQGREADARRGMSKTVQAMDYFSKSIGVPYPYERYAQICVDQFPGGMENTTATTMTDACLIDKRAALDSDVDLLVAHELAHQWFGDLLTCREWSHAWLNEGFATYFETLFTLHDKGKDEFDYELYRNKQVYIQEDKDRYRRPIVCATYKNPWVIFDRHLYEKGGWVLHMLHESLGEEQWWKSIGHYVRKHRNQSVVTDDLIVAIEETTGRNMRSFFEQWVFKSGYPAIKVVYQWNEQKREAEIGAIQTQPVSDDSPLFKLDVDLVFAGRGWTKRFTKKLDVRESRWSFKLPGAPLAVELYPEHKLLMRVDFRKPYALWEHQLLNAKSGLSRLLAAHEVARWGGARAVASLARALGREEFWGAAAEIASSIASIRTAAAHEALTSALKHRNPKIRRAVVQAMADFRDLASSQGIVAAAKRDPSIHVVAEALRTLGSTRDSRFLPLLRSKLAEKSYWDVVQAGAIQGLANLRDPNVLPLLLKMSRPPTSCPARLYAIRALASFASQESRVVPWLCENLDDRDERVGFTACQVLGRIEDERAVPALRKAREKTRSVRLQTYADEAVVRILAGAEGGAAAKAKTRKR